MEEKVILTNKPWRSFKDVLIKLCIILAVLSVIYFLFSLSSILEISSSYDDQIDRICSKGGYLEAALTSLRQAKQAEISAVLSTVFTNIILLALVIITIFTIVYFLTFTNELVITNCRVSGKVFGGKRVDIPLDSISAVSILPLINSVSVSSSSGQIRFPFMRNASELHTQIIKLILDRQENKTVRIPQSTNMVTSTADELKKYKELLDMGAITQEEFDAKKKQLLGL